MWMMLFLQLLKLKFNKKLSNYEEFEIGSKKSNTLSEITNMLIRFMRKEIKINFVDRSTNSIDVFVDNSKAISKIGYTP